MSFEVNWDGLSSDALLNVTIRDFLDQQFNSIALPSFIDNLSVTDFSLGTSPPEIVIRHIGTPLDDFYSDSKSDDEEISETNPASHSSAESENPSSGEEEHTFNVMEHRLREPEKDPISRASGHVSKDSKLTDVLRQLHTHSMNNLGLGPQERELPKAFFKPNSVNPSTNSKAKQKDCVDKSNDIQFVLEVDYRGDIMIEVSVNLLVNYPSSRFISLPIKLKLTDLEVHSLVAVAHIHQRVCISFLCDLNSSTTDYFSMHRDGDGNVESSSPQRQAPHTFHGTNFVDYGGMNNKERIDVIRSVRIDTEIGENENNVLRNVGKVEKFLVEQLRTIIRDEVCWPGWLCLDFADEVDSQVEDPSGSSKD